MSRTIKLHREYKGCTIWRASVPGSSMPWSATTGYRRVSADTLAGIKRLISEDMDPRSPRR